MLSELARRFQRWFGGQWAEKAPPDDEDEVKLDTIGLTFDRALARKKAREALVTRRDQGTPDDF